MPKGVERTGFNRSPLGGLKTRARVAIAFFADLAMKHAYATHHDAKPRARDRHTPLVDGEVTPANSTVLE